jgi:hypothetical protein
MLLAVSEIDVSEYLPGKIDYYFDNDQIHIIGVLIDTDTNTLAYRIVENENTVYQENFEMDFNLNLLHDFKIVEFENQYNCFLAIANEIGGKIINLTTGEEIDCNEIEEYSTIEVFSNDDECALYQVNGSTIPVNSFSMWYNSLEIPNYDPNFKRLSFTDNITKPVYINDDVEIFPMYPEIEAHAPFYVTGEIDFLNYPYDEEQFFLEGLFEPENDFIYQNNHMFESTAIFGNGPLDVDYVHMNFTGSSYDAKGIKVIYAPKELVVYDSFPPYGVIGDSIGVNIVNLPVDTLLLNLGGGSISNGRSAIVFNDLYIEGMVTGNIFIASTESIFITDDITYSGTAPGEKPTNICSDHLTLKSDKSIYIKYKSLDLFDGWYPGTQPSINTANTQDVYIYADLVTSEPGNCVTFEYQHPHPSTPPVYIDGEKYYPDLHLNQYPPVDNNWPSADYNVIGTNQKPDFPFYNPVWPEIDPVYERGVIHHFGSIISHNNGFMHRSGSDPYNHTEDGIWNIENQKYGPVHSPTGYIKRNRGDDRIVKNRSIDFVYKSDIGFSEIIIENGEVINSNIEVDFEIVDIRAICEDNGIAYLLVDCIEQDYPLLKSCFIKIEDNNISRSNYKILHFNENYDFEVKDDKIFLLRSGLYPGLAMFDFDFDDEYVYFENNYDFAQIFKYENEIYLLGTENEVTRLLRWGNSYGNMTFIVIDIIDLDVELCSITESKFKDYNLILYSNDPYFGFHDRYIYLLDLEPLLVANEQILQHNSNSMTIFPNPITNNRSNVNIKFQIKEKTQADVAIYNVKGQFVKNIFNGNVDSGEKIINWNQKNQNEKQVADGVYFVRAKLENDVLTEKVLIMK